jgi:ribosomal protein L11 methyltransferase
VENSVEKLGITCARLTLADEAAARRIADVLTESFDNNDAAVAAFETAGGRWDITVHFSTAPDEAAVCDLVALASDRATADSVTFAPVEDKDWVRASLDALAPVEAGRFVIHGSHDRDRIASNKTAIEIEAALAFGTGHHGTTRGCLLLLDEMLRRSRPARILDLGTGTGVLAIAAAKASRRKILASDIDRRSVEAARENARLNRSGPCIEVVFARGFAAPAFRARKPFDLVLANILANPLKALALPMRQHLAPGATVILSGLLPAQANGVIAAYRAVGLVLVRRLEQEGWTSLLLRLD